MVKSRSVKRNAKNASGIFAAATAAPFPKSRASYFRFARFNTSPLSESLAQATYIPNSPFDFVV